MKEPLGRRDAHAEAVQDEGYILKEPEDDAELLLAVADAMCYFREGCHDFARIPFGFRTTWICHPCFERLVESGDGSDEEGEPDEEGEDDESTTTGGDEDMT